MKNLTIVLTKSYGPCVLLSSCYAKVRMNDSSNESLKSCYLFKRLDNGELFEMMQGLESEKEILKTY